MGSVCWHALLGTVLPTFLRGEVVGVLQPGRSEQIGGSREFHVADEQICSAQVVDIGAGDSLYDRAIGPVQAIVLGAVGGAVGFEMSTLHQRDEDMRLRGR